MATDYSSFLDMTAEELYQDWLDYITSRDPLLGDTSTATFNSILAEAIASQFWIYIQLLKQKVHDSSILTATGDALSAIVHAILPEGRQAGARAVGTLKFARPTEALSDILIPAGTRCAAHSVTGQLIQFTVTEDVTLETGETNVYVAAQALNVGTDGNVSTGTVVIIRTPIVGISSCTNDAPFSGGTTQESDDDLRERALYAIWINGTATIPLMEEHIVSVDGVREVHVETLGQGDVLLVVDAEGDLDDEIDAVVEENMAAGCTAPGVLGASLRNGGDLFEIGDSAGAPVWVRTLQFLPQETTIIFVYATPTTAEKIGTAVLPTGSSTGHVVKAVLAPGFELASRIISSTYAGALSFDLFMGNGTYPRLWVAPELQAVDIILVLVFTATPEVDLLDSVKTSLEAKLASYMIGEQLEFADLVKYIYIDYATGRAFSGIDDISRFEITCKGSTITGFGQSIAIDEDERCEAGNVVVTEAA